MSSTGPTRTTSTRRPRFLVGFLVVALLIAGALSYLASSAPDGLDSVTLDGCQVTEAGGGEQLDGTCIAQHAQDHPLGSGPFADYSIGGADGSVGAAGIVGVLVVVLVATGLFWLLRRRSGPNDRS